jgi:hypothetical protein
LLDQALPIGDRSPQEWEQWCRAMMILLKPWRKPSDLKKQEETGTDVFDASDFHSSMLEVIKNMNVENKCKDAQDEYNKRRHAEGHKKPMLEQFVCESTGGDINSLDTVVMNNIRLDRGTNSTTAKWTTTMCLLQTSATKMLKS